MSLKPELSNPPTVEELKRLHEFLSRPEEMPVAWPPSPPETPEQTLLRIASSEEPVLPDLRNAAAKKTDLREEIWHCIRYWVFDYRYFEQIPSPFADVKRYSVPIAIFHGLSHWKFWMAEKDGVAGLALQACYRESYENDRPGEKVQGRKSRVFFHIPPDRGERRVPRDGADPGGQPYGLLDYTLLEIDGPTEKVLGAAESEYSEKFEHMERRGLRNLVAVHSPLKVIIHRMDYLSKLRRNDRFARRRQEIENAMEGRGANAADKLPADWLFIGIPYYDNFPRSPSDAFVQLYTLSTPCDSISLAEPDWQIWRSNEEMDGWFRSLYAV